MISVLLVRVGPFYECSCEQQRDDDGEDDTSLAGVLLHLGTKELDRVKSMKR